MPRLPVENSIPDNLFIIGTVNVDEIILHKENLRKGYRAIVDKRMGSKEEQMIYSDSLEKRTQ
jgi:pyruvate,water dikinase